MKLLEKLKFIHNAISIFLLLNLLLNLSGIIYIYIDNNSTNPNNDRFLTKTREDTFLSSEYILFKLIQR